MQRVPTHSKETLCRPVACMEDPGNRSVYPGAAGTCPTLAVVVTPWTRG